MRTSIDDVPKVARLIAPYRERLTEAFHRDIAYMRCAITLVAAERFRLANGRWFSVHAGPGKHELQSSAKNEPATLIETVANQTTYVQMIVVTGNWRGGGRLLQAAPADAQKVVAKLKPLHE